MDVTELTTEHEPSNLPYPVIREIAEEVGKTYSAYDVNGKVDLGKIINHLGGRVEVSHGNGSLLLDGPSSFTIYVPSHTSAIRDRFTKAHELAHYFLHYISDLEKSVEGKEVKFQRGESNLVETEANVFAASLLMPEDSFRKVYQTYNGDINQVARVFEVSPAAADVRRKVLGLGQN